MSNKSKSKTDRIATLERQVAALDDAVWELHERVDGLRRRLEPPPPKRSLADEAKARAADLGDRVLRAVGL